MCVCDTMCQTPTRKKPSRVAQPIQVLRAFNTELFFGPTEGMHLVQCLGALDGVGGWFDMLLHPRPRQGLDGVGALEAPLRRLLGVGVGAASTTDPGATCEAERAKIVAVARGTGAMKAALLDSARDRQALE